MQVAIASNDTNNVDQHFGQAGRFLIYELEGDFQTLISIKVLAPYSDDNRQHDFNPEKFARAADKLAGCARLYCAGIGEKPAAKLRDLGIEPVIYQGPIGGIRV